MVEYQLLLDTIECLQPLNAEYDIVLIEVIIDDGERRTFELGQWRSRSHHGFMGPPLERYRLYNFKNNVKLRLYVDRTIFIDEVVINAMSVMNGCARFTKDNAIYDIIYDVVKLAEVVTLAATDITATTATLNGQLERFGETPTCKCSFVWGLYATGLTPTPQQILTSYQNFTYTITGLKPNTTYHFKASSQNNIPAPRGYWESLGERCSFTSAGTTSNASSTTTSPTRPLVRQGVRPSLTPPVRQVRQMSRTTSNIPSTSRTQSPPINRSTLSQTNAQAPRPGSTAPSRIVTRSSPGGTPSRTQPGLIPRTTTSPTSNIPTTSRIQPAPVVKQAPPQTPVQTPVQSIKKALIKKK